MTEDDRKAFETWWAREGLPRGHIVAPLYAREFGMTAGFLDMLAEREKFRARAVWMAGKRYGTGEPAP